MDKNIAALLREDTRTVQVSFDQIAEDFDADEAPAPASKTYATNRPKSPGSKLYTYVTDLPLTIGDTVIVEARGNLSIAFIRDVHDDVKIEPNSDTTYKWVVAKVDLTGYAENVRRNGEIEQTVTEAYRNNMRRSFAQQILAGVDDAHRDGLTRLLGKSA